MINPFVSVHMIVKENTNLGDKFLNAVFGSLYEAYYPNEIVFINNGCAPFIIEKVRDYWVNKFKDFDCKLRIFDYLDNTDFCNLRNQCILNTNPQADFFHWCDSDEVYYPEELAVLKSHTLAEEADVSMVWSFFYHFIIDPFQIQADNKKTKKDDELGFNDIRSIKDNIFGFHKDIRWRADEKVHEHVANKKPGYVLESQCTYLHYGYCRQQWRTALKWFHYSMLDPGNVNGYKLDNGQEYFKDGRTPNSIISDRLKICVPYPHRYSFNQHLPEAAIQMIGGCKNTEDWINYINKLDSDAFWQEWQEEYKKTGKWSDTIDAVVRKCEECKWTLI